MIKSATSKLLLFAAAIAVSGCQLDEVLRLNEPCPDLESIVENGVKICSSDLQSQCFEKHNTGGDLRQIDFEAAFDFNLCPIGFVCRPEEHICELNTVDACNEGYTKCSQGNIYTCTADGKWGEEPTIECGETGCSEGTIQPQSNPLKCYECGADEAKCEGNKIITCSNHQKIATECEYGCVTTETNAYCRECKDGEKKCEKDFIVSCSKDGEKISRWDDDHKQSCENGCFPGARGSGSEVSCYECGDADKLKCFRDDETKVTTIKRCLAHNWHDEEDCALGCVEGTEAKCKLCNHGDKKYYNNEDGYCIAQECKDNQYQDVKTAEVSCNSDLSDFGDCLNGSSRCIDKGNGHGAFQYCENGAWKEFGIECDPNAPCAVLGNNKCIGNYVGQICSDDGKSLVACPNNASCKSDFSGCASCQSGTGKCNGNKILKCINGEYQEIECQAGSHCEAKDGQIQCVQHECDAKQQRCQGNIIQKCDNYKWTNISACENGEQCKENNGKAACSCISGTSYCDDTTAKNCKDGQWQTTACGQNKSCAMIGDEAKCIECESGTKCKDKSNIMTCQNNTWSAATSCADGMKCAGSAGNAKCVCTEGQAVCDSDKTKIKMCKDDGTYGSAESCGTDMQCQGVAGSAVCTSDAMECSPGEKRCNGDDLQTCNSNGKWEKTQTCDKGCANMACNVCTGNEKICENSYLKTCNNGQWKITYCGYGCYDNTQCLVCPTGIKQCSGNKLQTCLGNKWKEEECPNQCTTIDNYNATCKCTPGSVECVYSNHAKVCNQNSEWESKNCPGGCTNNVCKECQVNAEKCEEGNHSVCTSNGQWIPDGCEFGCSVETGKCYPECIPGIKKCQNMASVTCNENGEWPNPSSVACITGCNPQTGECNQIAECTDGEIQCVDITTLKYCLSNAWYTQTCKCDHNECATCTPICQYMSSLDYILVPCYNNSLDFESISHCIDPLCKKCE